MNDLHVSFENLITYGSYIVSLTVAYYTLVIRIVRLETKAEQAEINFSRMEASLNEIKNDIKELLKHKRGWKMIVKKHKFHVKGYFAPTPVLFRKIGDSLLGASQFAAGYAVVAENKEVAITFMIIGVIGKAMTNFFTEIPVVEDSKEQNL